jgi:hypothetical protein
VRVHSGGIVPISVALAEVLGYDAMERILEKKRSGIPLTGEELRKSDFRGRLGNFPVNYANGQTTLGGG